MSNTIRIRSKAGSNLFMVWIIASFVVIIAAGTVSSLKWLLLPVIGQMMFILGIIFLFKIMHPNTEEEQLQMEREEAERQAKLQQMLEENPDSMYAKLAPFARPTSVEGYEQATSAHSASSADNKKVNIIIFLVMLLGGLGMMIYGIADKFHGISIPDIPDAVMLGLFVFLGLALCIIPSLSYAKNLKRLTETVEGRCVQLQSAHGSPRKKRPIYSFVYRGSEYIVYKNVYSNRGNPKLDEVRELLIDPEDPQNNWVDPISSRSLRIGLALIGLIFLIVAGIAIWIMFFK